MIGGMSVLLECKRRCFANRPVAPLALNTSLYNIYPSCRAGRCCGHRRCAHERHAGSSGSQQRARQKKGSARHRKTKSAISREHVLVARRNKDWVEKTTTRLVRDYNLVVVEDLRVNSMVATPAPKPDRERPGHFLPNGTRAKAGLNRAIHQHGWSVFATRLEQKASISGATVLKMNPAYASSSATPLVAVARMMLKGHRYKAISGDVESVLLDEKLLMM